MEKTAPVEEEEDLDRPVTLRELMKSDEVSASADDNASECDLTIPDSEIVIIAGVSETSQLPVREVGPSPSRGRSVIPKPHPKAVVSLVTPHKLLIVSKEFCNLFGFFVENDLCGRAVRILQGPRTDPSLLLSGIKGAALSSTTRSNVVLYDRAGRDIELDIAFSLFLSGDISGDGSSAGCLMELSLVPGGS
jgi:hypothetical protein